jgi:glycerol uptake facilitator-like aquaporin
MEMSKSLSAKSLSAKSLGAETEHTTSEASAPAHRPVASVELIATLALALLTLVAVTAVSIGIARADVFGAHADTDAAPFAIALFIGLLLSAMGGLTALMAGEPARRD